MEAIGGYLGLEVGLKDTKEYHRSAIRLNNGRNALRYLLLEREVQHIHLPHYICKAVLEPIKEIGIDYDFYKLDTNLEIVGFESFSPTSYVLYPNYFGLKGRYLEKIARTCSNLIVDNSQAFFDKPLKDIDTFYSPRKFFGVPGGGYVYGIASETVNLERDLTYNRASHLFIRPDKGAEAGYATYHDNEKKMSGRPLRRMSLLTQKILVSLDYKRIKEQRISNYQILHEALGEGNQLFNLANYPFKCPLIYPYKNSAIDRAELIKHKIYVPQYWPSVDLSRISNDSIEHIMTDDLIALPIDQRYSEKEMLKVIEVVERYE